MKNCRICNTSISPFISFGRMPIANGFLIPEQYQDEYFFELATAFCEGCGMVQIIDQPEPEQMFHEDYAFFSGTSRFMSLHFQEFAKSVMQTQLRGREDPFVVELGSNDGIMLQNFKDAGIRHLGIEPSSNVANAARAKGINTISEFFNAELAGRIIEEHGYADAVLAANVMCHIPTLSDIAEGISALLSPKGVLIFEDPYLGDVIEKTSYDQIYDEHVFVFSARSVRTAFSRHGLDLVHVEPQTTHGGSMRYTLAKNGAIAPSDETIALLDREDKLGLMNPATFEIFRENCERSRDDLMALLNDLKAQGKSVAGYGATSKSTTVINYCGITPEHINFISDTTPTKHHKFTPGAHIPVKPYDTFKADYPDYALLFAWNHKDEIMGNEQAFAEAGGKWINYVPKIEVFG
jgi:methylation protein EvaC